jgi:L-threonylcarbamoyladenylate synthase
MKTEIIDESNVIKAAKWLKDGEVVCFPTETVYGIGVIANSQRAFDKLVEAKRRPPTKPFSLMCSSLEQAFSFCETDIKAKAVMKAFMPGEITVLVKAKEGLDHWITLGTPVIGIRVPDSKYVLELIDCVGSPCLVTSANHSGDPTSTSFEDTVKSFDGEVKGIVKGECTSLVASTIVDLSDPTGIKLVRPGPIPFEKIEKTWRMGK